MVDAQMLFNALMAWKVEFDRANGTEYQRNVMRQRGIGHADMLIQAAMVAFDEESDAAEMRVAEEFADRTWASRG